MGILSAIANAAAQWRANRHHAKYSLRTGEPWPPADAAAFVAEVEASGLFESVDVVPVEPPRLIDLHLEAPTGESFIVMVVDGYHACRVFFEAYVFDWVPTCLVLEFLRAVMSGEVEVAREGGHVVLGVPLAGEGTWEESRVFRGEFEPWEARAMARDRAPGH
ncbi:hypothetical protein GCM10009639_50580 [Kitasatospora putterlickiae]|uniref:Uncharacterized protein n=1 Tax=Kitasatospora putterlickiae TaxID=221725 RepID=A0ABP4J0Q7_9ACTN